MRVIRRVAISLIAVFAPMGCGRAESSPGLRAALRDGHATVTQEVDGDTIHASLGGHDEKVRFLGIDTPETHGPNGLRECFGKEASKHTAALIPVGTKVRLVRDVEARDRYGRLLAYVYRVSDGLFVNLALARDGYADVLTYPPNVSHATEFVAAAADARAHNRGLWRACGSADVPIA